MLTISFFWSYRLYNAVSDIRNMIGIYFLLFKKSLIIGSLIRVRRLHLRVLQRDYRGDGRATIAWVLNMLEI